MPLAVSSVYPSGTGPFSSISSRRSVVHSTKGIVSCTQPLAAKCGIEVLAAGGNCADAAVAVAAGLNVAEPCSTGIGGDMFCLFYDAQTKKISALNGSGRAGRNYSLETTRESLGFGPNDGKPGKIDLKSVHSVTVPGAAAGWCDTVERFGSGKLSMEEILKPAIQIAEEGFSVSEIASHNWHKAEQAIRDASPNFREMLKRDPSALDGVRPPRPGEIMRNSTLAATFRTLAAEGKKGFYSGRIAEEIIKVVKDLGGHLELDDLAHHLEMGSEPVDPISLKFRGQGVAEMLRDSIADKNEATGGDLDVGLELWEHPPNGQGIVALMALGIIQELEKQGKIPRFTLADFNTAPYLHAIIEALRIAFSDASWWVADPNVSKVPTAELIAEEYLAERAKLYDPTKASTGAFAHGSPALLSSDTVYFAVSDSEGNAISFINSNYAGFGTCIIPKGCGFTLQNRGANFSLDKDHPNVISPRKRPYHTIIPAAVMNIHDGSLHSIYGVMGGFMQPQGHIQVLLGQIVGGLNPQQALDAPRICIESFTSGTAEHNPDLTGIDMTVSVEEGMSEQTIEDLKKLGHLVKVVKGSNRALFGRGQLIRWSVDPVEGTGIWSAGSDPRGDGMAFPR